MKILATIMLAVLAAAPVLAQTKAVTKTISTNTLTEALAVPSGMALTIKAGATLNVEAGANVSGLGSDWSTLVGRPATINTLADGFLLSGPVIWDGSTYAIGTIGPASIGLIGNNTVLGNVSGITSTASALTASQLGAIVATAKDTVLGLSTTGFVKRTGANTYAIDTATYQTTTGTLALGGFTVTGTLAVANGGTGQTTVQAAINALMAASGALSQGDVFYYNGTNVVRLAAGTSGQFLKTNGASANPSWADVSVSPGGSTTQVQYNSSGSFAGNSGFTYNATTNSLTIGGATLTTSAPALNITQTWNASGVTFTGSLINITDTASANGSKLLDVQLGGTTYFKVVKNGPGNGITVKDGHGFFTAGGNGWYMSIGSTVAVQCSLNSFILYPGVLNLGDSGGGPTVALDGATSNILKIVKSTNAQTFQVYNTYTSSTNLEDVELGWTGNVAHLWTVKGSGGGSARDLVLGRDSTAKLTIGANTTDHAQPAKLASYTVAGLPSASTCGFGSLAAVTDSNATTVGATVAGGGSNKCVVVSDGSNWKILIGF